ncbi:hypothetical protein D3C73_1248480 [compost metagenome]
MAVATWSVRLNCSLVPLAISPAIDFNSPLALSRSWVLTCKRLKVSARKSRRVLAAVASLPSSSWRLLFTRSANLP